jgi:hypothetical protein
MANAKEVTSFADRLAKYGLTVKDVHSDTLRVGKNQVVYLGSLGKKQSFHAPRFLRASGIKDVKRWIGTSDSVLRRNRKVAERRKLAKPPSEKMLASFDRLHAKYLKAEDPVKKDLLREDINSFICKNRKSIGVLARAYTYGPSSAYRTAEPMLDWYVRDLTIPFWAFNTVIVESGSVLEFDEGFNTLATGTLVIEEGGTIRSTGSLNLDITEVNRTV